MIPSRFRKNHLDHSTLHSIWLETTQEHIKISTLTFSFLKKCSHQAVFLSIFPALSHHSVAGASPVMKVVPPPSPPTTPSRGDPGAHWLHLLVDFSQKRCGELQQKLMFYTSNLQKNSSGKHSPPIKHHKTRCIRCSSWKLKILHRSNGEIVWKRPRFCFGVRIYWIYGSSFTQT